MAAALVLHWVAAGSAAAAQRVIDGPPGSETFAREVVVLPNGHFVVRDPFFDASPQLRDVGAVYHHAADGRLISTLRGSRPGDFVGIDGIRVLSTGNYLVISSLVANGAAIRAGAVTFASGESGVDGVVTAANSLIGRRTTDEVGARREDIVVAPSGDYLVISQRFTNQAGDVEAGAVSFGSGLSGVSGEISLGNSLVGGQVNDRIGSRGARVLPGGNFLVLSPEWDDDNVPDAGAVTFIPGATGLTGTVNLSNSLIGAAGERVGLNVTVLDNGDYVTLTQGFRNGSAMQLGAATLGSGQSGARGQVSAQNSLVGSRDFDLSGSFVVPLGAGAYALLSPLWDNGAVADAGALTIVAPDRPLVGPISAANSLLGTRGGDLQGASVAALGGGAFLLVSPRWDDANRIDAGALTRGTIAAPPTGSISSANSLLGTSTGDLLGAGTPLALAGGASVIAVPRWDHGAVVDAGAAVYLPGAVAASGPISAANALVGSSTNDRVASGGITRLANGNYVVASPQWDHGGIVDAGAATFGTAASGAIGSVSAANSLVGGSAGDAVASRIVALPNGNYVVGSTNWANGASARAGAATFGDANIGVAGPVSASNSLIGSALDDRIGSGGIVVLPNSDYLVVSPQWRNAQSPHAGSVTLGSGSSGVVGAVDVANSLVGSSAEDRVGSGGVVVLDNGGFVVASPGWRNAGAADSGAATFGAPALGIAGAVSALNSLVGTTAGDAIGQRVEGLPGGDYVVRAPAWDQAGRVDAGAIAFARSGLGVRGALSALNALVGTSTSDRVGSTPIVALANGNFFAASPAWDNGLIADVGAVSLAQRGRDFVGPISVSNSVIGVVRGGISGSNPSAYDPVRNQLIVGDPAANRVVLHRPGFETTTVITGVSPQPSGSGQPVLFSARVAAQEGAPTAGIATFRATSGESCIDPTLSPASADGVAFSCSIVFANPGVVSVFVEYTGSADHAFSASSSVSLTVVLDPIFGDGFGP
jgi:hypothetical protein